MRKIIFAAVAAACFALPGGVDAQLPCPSEVASFQTQLDPALVHNILKAASEVTEYSLEEWLDMNDQGIVAIEQISSHAYLVSLTTDGNTDILIEDIF